MSNQKKKSQNSQGIPGMKKTPSVENQIGSPKAKPKNPPTPPSANGKDAKQSLPRVHVSWQNIDGMPYINDREVAATYIRTYFTPEVWVQQHLFALFTDSWGKLMCIRRVGIGDADCCIVDTKLILNIGTAIQASNLTLGLTRPTGFTEPGIPNEQFMKRFDDLLAIMGINLEWFLVMSKDGEQDAAEELFRYRSVRELWDGRMLI